jgi:hypothetical protein
VSQSATEGATGTDDGTVLHECQAV